MKKVNDLSSLALLKMQLEKKELEIIPLLTREIIHSYSISMGYRYSINRFRTVIKLVNPANNKSGFIKWYNNSLLWGYFAKDGDNKKYICLHNIDQEISIYEKYKEIFVPKNRISSGIDLMRRMFYGILDLELS